MMNSADRINYLNILFMLLSVDAAIYLPFELFLFSYAFLGPAHYLTEISWLHDRKYFTPLRTDFIILGILTVIYILFVNYAPAHSIMLIYAKKYTASIIFFLFGLAFVFIAVAKRSTRLWLSLILLLGIVLINSYSTLSLLFGLYLPTLVHVYLFTGAFILYGALKSNSRSGYLSFAVFLLCPVLCLLLFRHYNASVSDWAMSGYHSFSKLNKTILNSIHLTNESVFSNPASIQLTRIIAFAYTYHYLNWFSKTSVIQWHRVSLFRIVFVAALFVCFISLYLWNYKTGLQTLFFLSFLHVVLEFPLNHRSFIGIVKEMNKRRKRKMQPVNHATA